MSDKGEESRPWHPTVVVEDITDESVQSSHVELKTQGNALYKLGRYSEAAEKYTGKERNGRSLGRRGGGEEEGGLFLFGWVE